MGFSADLPPGPADHQRRGEFIACPGNDLYRKPVTTRGHESQHVLAGHKIPADIQHKNRRARARGGILAKVANHFSVQINGDLLRPRNVKCRLGRFVRYDKRGTEIEWGGGLLTGLLGKPDELFG